MPRSYFSELIALPKALSLRRCRNPADDYMISIMENRVNCILRALGALIIKKRKNCLSVDSGLYAKELLLQRKAELASWYYIEPTTLSYNGARCCNWSDCGL